MTTATTPSTMPDEWDRRLNSRTERYAAGKALRSEAPRSSHAKWAPDPERPDPISMLEKANSTRLVQLVPIRYGRMSTSAFAFYRGSADIMAYDLAKTPVSGIQAQLCGDAHLSNFGVFASPERRQVFDVNDFDETLAGPWEWDVKRLAASVVLAGRQNGYAAQDSKQAVLRCIQRYRESIQQFALMNHLDVWYYHLDVESLLAMARVKENKKALLRASERASKRTRTETFPKLAEAVDGQYRIKDEPPLIFHYDELHPSEDNLDTGEWKAMVKEYLASLPEERRVILMRYRSLDVAQKVVGVGSVGTRCAIVLALGGSEGDDPLFMQIKEAGASVLESYLGASPYPNHGQRVVVGQRLMQAASDIFLGWMTFNGRDYYARQLRDMKFSAEVETMDPVMFTGYVELCAATLARAHARTGDSAMISGYLGNRDVFDQAIASFAELYADQAERDHAALLAAMKKGRVQAQTGV
ncbi:MAG TPA: DUF2252 domain-containing protein [Ktedonobacteraceae bacterium]|nr:DUF2252 domain-containing protein [Ktedonobacteraceae bacterium]